MATASGSTAQPHLYLNDIRDLPIAVPGLSEQDAIVETVEDQFSIIDHLETDLETKLKNALALRQSILRDAFNGRLVREDRNDEPASELLKRIIAERQQRDREAAAAKRPNGRKQTSVVKPGQKAIRA